MERFIAQMSFSEFNTTSRLYLDEIMSHRMVIHVTECPLIDTWSWDIDSLGRLIAPERKYEVQGELIAYVFNNEAVLMLY